MELALQDGGPQRRLTQGEAKRVSREAMASDILTLNAGSSSLKFSLWQSGIGIGLRELFRGEIKKIGIAPHLFARDPVAARLSTADLKKAAPSSATRASCASSSPGFRDSGKPGSRRSAIGSCTVALGSPRRSALTTT
jgi:hypothetical protein